MANFNLTVGGCVGIGPGSRPVCEAQMGGALLRMLIEDGPGGLLGLGALPAHCQVISPFGGPIVPATDYGNLDNSGDDTIYTVWIVDSAGTDANPAPTFETLCTDKGGTYVHSAS